MNIRLRRWLIALLILILAAVATRWVMQRRAASTNSGQPAPTSAQLVSDTVELSPADLIGVQEQTLVQQVQVSGNVQSARSAWVKARIAGDVRELRVKEGDTVQQGQTIGRIDDADAKDRLQQAKRQVEMAQAQLKTAQLAFDNNQVLVNKNFISQTALINSQAALSSAEANLQSAIAGERIANKAVSDALLVAPFSGQVASVATQMGERANVDARIVELVDLSQMEVMVTLNPNEASAIKVGQTASLRVEGVSQDVTARLQRINPSVDPATRSVRAYLQLPGTPGLRQGLFAQGQISISQAKGLAVPLSAVRNDRPSPYVFKVQEGRIAMQAIDLGIKGPLSNEQEGETWVMVKGLNPGDAILASTVGTVREGLKVTSKTKAPAPAAPSAQTAPTAQTATPAAGQGK